MVLPDSHLLATRLSSCHLLVTHLSFCHLLVTRLSSCHLLATRLSFCHLLVTHLSSSVLLFMEMVTHFWRNRLHNMWQSLIPIVSSGVDPVCAVFLCVQTVVWLPMLGTFNVCTGASACDCSWGLYERHNRVCTENGFGEDPSLHWGLEPASAMMHWTWATSPPHMSTYPQANIVQKVGISEKCSTTLFTTGSAAHAEFKLPHEIATCYFCVCAELEKCSWATSPPHVSIYQ